jgi:hypothetical protein
MSAVCAICSREIEVCAFCEGEDCRACICFRCMITTLGHALPQPHTHGG